MKQLIKLCFLLVTVSGGLLFTKMALATCITNNAYSAYATMRGVNYSVGADFPVGGVIYKQQVIGVRNVDYSCNAGNANFVLSVSGGTPIAGMDNTYESGIPGVGIQVLGLNGARAPLTVTGTNSSGTLLASNLSFFIIAVKTGPLTAGNANGSILPTVQWDVVDNSGVKEKLAYSAWNGSGFILRTPSCTTPDFNYDLGSSVISNSITSSEWVSTPITLSGCGTFYGNASDGNSYQSARQSFTAGQLTGLQFAEQGTRGKNIITMTLSPQITAIDPANGILANTSANGNAEGVGVQIARVAGTTYTPFDLTSSQIVYPNLNSSGDITFSLAARMIKTANVVRPGNVITAATYTITYQ